MSSGRRIERRQAKHTAFTLEHSFLFRLSPRVAWILVLGLLALAAAVEHAAPDGLWFGPIYLAVMVLAAWSIHPGAAIAIGAAVLAARLVLGTLPFYPTESALAGPNLAVRSFGILVVIGFIAIARKSCEREWRFARTDPLTGAWNRQAFFEIIRGSRESGGWSAMIFADLDGLKRLNDAEGHSQGDLSLKLFAQTVRGTIREGDVFARMGGDEFVIFMQLKDEAAGTAVARRLHKALNAAAPADSGPRLTCSLGVLLLPAGSKAIDGELRAADELMYEAKKARAGVLVATAIQRDGTVRLGAKRSVYGPWEPEAAPRADRTGATPVRSSDRPQARPEPPIAA